MYKLLMFENLRFEWFDGVIVWVVEIGVWLVFDNVNFCSVFVLDRLNLFLEWLNGIFSINEYSGLGGELRIIKFYFDFRIFLMVDLRYGELLRVMRNCLVEIYFDVFFVGISVVVERIVFVDGMF